MISEGLNRNELEALRILWEAGPLKPADIQARFDWPIENATLRSVLVQLVEKGQAEREEEGKAFVYRARVAKSTLLHGLMERLARVFAGGSHQALVAQLVESGDLTPEDLAILHRTAKNRGKSKSTPRNPRS